MTDCAAGRGLWHPTAANLLALLLAVGKIPDPPDAGARFFLEDTTVLLLVALADFHVFSIVQVTPGRTPELFARFSLSLSY